MQDERLFSNETDSIPTNMVGVESKNNNQLRVLSDTTDAQGVRHVTIQTTAAGNDREGYKTAERHAHSWFFVNYDRNFQRLDSEAKAEIALEMIEDLIEAGDLDRAWLECSHPAIALGKKRFMFGHHTGLNPTATEPTWGFQFEILPMGAAN
jgi:hypothetical protein